MNGDSIKGMMQKVGGHIEEAAGALVGDANLKDAGKEDQLKGSAREAWGGVKDAAGNLVDKAKAAKYDAEHKQGEVSTFEREHDAQIVDETK